MQLLKYIYKKMRLNTVFLFLLLIISITSEISLDSYSIDKFKIDLKKEGLLEIIESILKAYNKDIAILSCEELVGNRKWNCKRLVIEYVNPTKICPPPAHACSRDLIENYNIKCIKKLYYLFITNSLIIKNSILIKKELRRKFTENQSNLIFNKISKRVRDLGPCEEWFLIFNEIKKIIIIIIKLYIAEQKEEFI